MPKSFEDIAYSAALQIVLTARADGYETIPMRKMFFEGDIRNLAADILEWLMRNMQEEAPCGPSEH